MIENYYSQSYAESREKFLKSARKVSSTLFHYKLPLGGPNKEELATDVSFFKTDRANHLIIVNSGTHGVEGFAGSACQVGLLEEWEGNLKPKAQNTAVLMVHALNPYGFAWLRRVNEDNIDLNRNFIDHSQPPSANPAYDENPPMASSVGLVWRIALRGDQWLNLNPSAKPEEARKIKADIRAAYYVEAMEWKRKIYDQTKSVFKVALSHLSE